jgi:hypothetical protein
MKTPNFNLQNFAKENVMTFSNEQLKLISGGVDGTSSMCSLTSDMDSGYRDCSISNDVDVDDTGNPSV